MKKKVGREDGKWLEYAWYHGDRCIFLFNLASILKQFCFRFRSLQPND
jgi:hypothetical protein